MRTIWKPIRENREETIKFLKTQEDNRYTFVHFDEEEDDWCDDEGVVDLGDVCPFVIYGDNDANIKEYVVTSISLDKECPSDMLVNIVDPYDYKETMEIPVGWLYGASECYIYEALMDLETLED